MKTEIMMAATKVQTKLQAFTSHTFITPHYRTLCKSRYCNQRSILRYFSDGASSAVRVRFAPSPTGFLHLGGLRTALYNFLFARSKNGNFILRIEDTDQSRTVPGAIEKIKNILHWAGITPDEGPVVGGDYGPYIQSERLHLYQKHIQTLLNNGWAYPCFCSARRLELMRKEAARKGEPSKYDNRCRTLSQQQIEKLKLAGTEYAIRLKLQPTPEPWDDMVKGEISHNVIEVEGDPVLLKSDGYPTYHFANVVDDHLMEVSHVLRGQEWLSSTPKHILIYKAFGWTPPIFGHLPLIVNEDRTKISKRQNDIHVEHFRDLGYLPQAVLNYITSVGGGFDKSTVDMTLKDMCESFSASRIRSSASQLSPVWLSEANRYLLRQMVTSDNHEVRSELVRRVREIVITQFSNSLAEGPVKDHILSDNYILSVIQWSLTDERTSVISDFVKPELQYLWITPSQATLSELVTMEQRAESIIAEFLKWISTEENFSFDHLGPELRRFAETRETKASKFFALMRMALTGLKQGPPLAEMISVIGKDSVIARLETSLATIRRS